MSARRTALHGVQLDHGAVFGDVEGFEVPLDYGDPLAECRAVREATGLLERPLRCYLGVSGADRYTWLQGMVTNDVRRLESGSASLWACVLDATGHLLGDVTVVRRQDDLVLDVPGATRDRILAWLQQYVVSEDVVIEDLTGQIVCLSLQGPTASLQDPAGASGGACVVVPADHTGEGGQDCYVPAEAAPQAWHGLVTAGVPPVGQVAAETLRIEAGIPRYGADMDEATIPLECGLGASHVSQGKGCYVGQEIIARIQSRGHTNRALTGLLLEGSELPCKGDAICPTHGEDADRKVGWATSAAHSPMLGRSVALAYVRHEYREPGTHIRVIREDGVIPAIVTPLPFYRKP